jgi:CheY-like chemotaxis protein
MPVITLFSGIFCNEAAVLRDVVESTGHRLITDEMVIAGASELPGIKTDTLKTAFSSKTSVFNPFTHEKDGAIAHLRLSLARMLTDENLIISGHSGLLLPETIDHVLRVCLTAESAFRLTQAKIEQHLSEEAATRLILLKDTDRSVWTDTLFSIKNPWDVSLYDMVLPMDQTDPAKAAALIRKNLLNKAAVPADEVNDAINDFLLASTAAVALVNAGHNVKVHARKGRIELTINKKVHMLSHLEEELKTIVGKIPGVRSVEAHVKGSPHPSDVYWKRNFELPSKLLLVDDEKDFVQTLSERLQIRDMGSTVAYDGISALDIVRNDAPEVMVIDLKMPGMDGMDVLKQVKQTRPEIEVIILTGHGSELDRKECMDLGAFSYLQKPVDIDQLSETLKKAHEKIKAGESTAAWNVF